MDRKFIPENTSNIEFHEPDYLRSKVLICLSIVAAVVPVIGLIIAILISRKSKNFHAQWLNLSTSVAEELKLAETVAKKKISDAQSAADKLTADTQAAADKLTTTTKTAADMLNANAQANAKSIVDVAHSQAERILHSAETELARIQSEIDNRDVYLREVETIKSELIILQKKHSSLVEKIDVLMRLRKAVNGAVKKYLSTFQSLPDHMISLPTDELREIETFVPTVTLKLHSMDYRDLRRAFRANEKLIEDTLTRYEGRYTTKTNRAIYRLMVIALRAELQNILYTLTSSKLNDAIGAVRDVANKYLNIVREGNQTISSTLATFVGEIETLFIAAVKIEYEYFVKREAARQEQLELRAKMREEAEEQRRLREQQRQMEREESKFTAEIENLLEQVQSTDDDAKNQALLDKIKELELQLADLSIKKDEILTLQNGKAGYVYVISNLGSFGDDVFKVGMTRRLNPQERIDELGSASVPFKFDVHSFIFSQDAVKLESDLHTALDSYRLNKVNFRKEFFKISIDDLERLVEKFDPAAEFNRTMQAEQYYQSLSAEQ